MSDIIYLIIGNSGEHECYEKHVVCGFYSKILAEDYIEKATKEANVIFDTYKKSASSFWANVSGRVNKYDKDMIVSPYYKTKYFIKVVELKDEK